MIEDPFALAGLDHPAPSKDLVSSNKTRTNIFGKKPRFLKKTGPKRLIFGK